MVVVSLASQLAGAARNALCADNGLCIRQDRARVGIDRLAERVLVDRRLCLCVSDRHRSATHERRLAVAREPASDRAKASAEPHRARPSRVVGRTGPAAQAPSTAYAPARQTGSRQDTDEPIERGGAAERCGEQQRWRSAGPLGSFDGSMDGTRTRSEMCTTRRRQFSSHTDAQESRPDH